MTFRLLRRIPPNVFAHTNKSSSRQREVERAAFFKFALRPHSSTVRLHNVFDDGEAEAGAAELTAACFVDTIKTLKDMKKMLLGDAGAIVGDRGYYETVLFLGRDRNAATVLCVVDGVVEQVEEDLMQSL